jgi:class 3 adenylate cyclase
VTLNRLIGDPERFSLEHRVFNGATLLLTLIALLSPGVYLLLEHRGRLLLGVGALGSTNALLYLLGRFRNRSFPSLLGLTLVGAGVIVYFLTGGSAGPAICTFAAPASLAVVLLDGAKRILMALFSIATPMALLAMEYFRPGWVSEAWTSRDVRYLFFALAYSGAILTLLTVAWVLVSAYRDAMARLAEERARSERLLDNVLPPSVSARLKQTPGTIADGFEGVTVLFADLVGFTTRAAGMAPGDVVAMLNEIFSKFDALSEKFGLEKIKTIGDAYMAVAGIPIARNDHAEAAADMALEMLRVLPEDLALRVGLHSGAAVAGVIGTRKFIYDLWGDTVNTASRMESHGEAGRIQVTRQTHDLLAARYRLSRRGVVAIKGKGELETFFLEGQKS